MAEKVIVPVGVRLSTDIEYRPDRPDPYRARVRWFDPATKRRLPLSEGKADEDEETVRRQTTPAPGGLTDKGTKGTKGKRARKVPIIEEIRPLVAQRILSAGPAPDARLFTGPRGGRISTAVLRDATHWDEVVTQLGYEHPRRHDLRHTGLTWLADAGVRIHVLRRIAGHGSPTTTQRYLHPDVHKITAAGTALSAHLSVLRAPRSLPATAVLTR
ncbi:tyrosine-type recombinase/integrase [Streptomyces sp. NBC_00878]|uniref:tyrosine-type recombinase/integrase n=1 Tax=Streptomyces sp. NBC_00878 TaxID=2975854 RepID=UPI002251AB6B|nr:tyrosine-type recombinase/integrase [Streptomyces sp. NBC_00878]MCX4903552.1 tyrosine-type recombinase/integrase [Streptomyces sp. NBC_00878]